MRERDEAALAGRVGEGVTLGHMRPRGCDQYHAALGAPEMLLAELRQEEARRQVRGDDSVPVFQRRFGKRLAVHDACVGDDGIDPAESACSLVDQALHVRFFRDIAGHGVAPAFRRRFFGASRVHIRAHAAPPARPEFPGARPADAMTRAGDDRYLGVIRLHANFPFCAFML